METSQVVVDVTDGSDDPFIIGLPPGFRFHPTDEEIITHYLTPKVLDRSFIATAMGEADLNKSEPWDLPEKAKTGENGWFFFCPRDRKYPTGMRTNRATERGYWKATGKDKEILRGKEVVGMKKTLVFYEGRAPRGDKTNWVMHEFRLHGKFSYYSMPTSVSTQDEWVVCRVFHKSTVAQRSPVSDHRLDTFVEELLNNQPQLPPLLDHSHLNHDLSFTVGHSDHFSHEELEIFHKEDDKNIFCSPYNYNFDTNTYQASSLISEHQCTGKNSPCLTSASSLYSSNIGIKIEKNAFDKCGVKYLIPTFNQSGKTNVSHDIKVSNDVTNSETSSISMLSKHDMKTRGYNQDDNDDDDPSTFSELDSLLQY